MIEKNPLLKNRIQFYNQVDNISEYYLNAFMFVLPSRCEGMSNSLLEAMSYGMPCISTRVSGSNDLIVNNQNGMLVDIGSDTQLAETILYLFSHLEIAFSLGLHARETIIKNYQIDLIADGYLKVYNQIIAKND